MSDPPDNIMAENNKLNCPLSGRTHDGVLALRILIVRSPLPPISIFRRLHIAPSFQKKPAVFGDAVLRLKTLGREAPGPGPVSMYAVRSCVWTQGI